MQTGPFRSEGIMLGITNFGVEAWVCNLLAMSFGRRQWHPTPVLLPGKSHGWRSLVGCSPWDH